MLFIHCRGFRETGIVWFWRRQCWTHFSGGSSHAVGLDTGRSVSWSLAFSVNKSRARVELGVGWKFLNAFLQIHHISWKKYKLPGKDLLEMIRSHLSWSTDPLIPDILLQWCWKLLVEGEKGKQYYVVYLCGSGNAGEKLEGDSVKPSTLPRLFPQTLPAWWSVFVETEHWKRNGHLLLSRDWKNKTANI